MESLVSFGTAFGLYKYSALISPIVGMFIPSVLSALCLSWGFTTAFRKDFVDQISILD